MSQKMLMIINPYAGMRVAYRRLAEIIEVFCKADYTVTTCMTMARGDGHKLVKEHGKNSDVIVCVGGDGTFNEVISGIVDEGITTPVGYIAAGSTNDFASSLGLPKNVVLAARSIVDGKVEQYDVGKFGDRYFSYVASFGAFTKASYTTSQNVKNILGHLAYVLEGIMDVPSIKPRHVRIETPDRVFDNDYIFGALSNSTSVGGILTLDPDTVDMSDGLFEVLLVKSPDNAIELSDCIRALNTKQYESSSMIEFASANEATIIASPDMDWTLDGEYAKGTERISVKNIYHAINLIVPNK